MEKRTYRSTSEPVFAREVEKGAVVDVVNEAIEDGGVEIPKELPETLGTAGQVLTVNQAGTGVEWADAQGGGGTQLYRHEISFANETTFNMKWEIITSHQEAFISFENIYNIMGNIRMTPSQISSIQSFGPATYLYVETVLQVPAPGVPLSITFKYLDMSAASLSQAIHSQNIDSDTAITDTVTAL